MYEIEKDIPIPVASRNRKEEYAALENLEVGDSFFIKVKIGTEHHIKTCSVYNNARKIGIKIATRKQDGGMRIWRVE